MNVGKHFTPSTITKTSIKYSCNCLELNNAYIIIDDELDKKYPCCGINNVVNIYNIHFTKGKAVCNSCGADIYVDKDYQGNH